MQWHLLDRCNLRCQHCYQDDFSARRELSWEQIRRVAENLLATMKKWGTKLEVALTGGEPFLKKELPELIKLLDSSPSVAEISIITNGLVLPSWVKDLKSVTKFKTFKISVDGTSSRTNDGLRGEGALAQALAGMKKLKELGLPFLLMFTAMKTNQPEAWQLFALAAETGASGFIIERFFPLGQGKNKSHEVLTSSDFLSLWLQVLDRCGLEAAPEELIPYRAIKVELAGRRPKVYGSKCIIGRDGMAIMPDGTCYPCRRLPLPLGNLLLTPLHELWAKSTLLKNLKNKNKLGGRCGLCQIKDCLGCRAMTYALTGDPLAPDPHCWLDIVSYQDCPSKN